MKKYLVTILFVQSIIYSYSQYAYEQQVYKKVVYDFYDHILNKKLTSLKDYEHFFGPYAEEEIALFFKECQKTKTETECIKIEQERQSRWSSYESLVFVELKKLKKSLTQAEDVFKILDKMQVIDNRVLSSVDVVLTFSNQLKVIFMLNNVENESPYIIDIFLTDGSSIFTAIVGRKGAYKRMAVINDSDGFTNVRKDKGTDYPIEFKLYNNDVFFVFPNYKEDWWLIQTLDCKKGYVSKSRINLIGNLPEKEIASWADTVTYIYSRPPDCN